MAETVLREFAMRQVQRLGVFREFSFVNGEAQKEFRKWLETRCVTKPRMERLMDAAIELEHLPGIADLNRLYGDVFPAAAAAIAGPDSPEERRAAAEHMRRWYEQEALEAEERKAALARMPRNRVSRPAMKSRGLSG